MSRPQTEAPDTPFSDGKEPGALRTIGEVSAALGIRQHILRYWEHQFPMLRPLKRSGGRRYYRTADLALISRIDHLLNKEGYTIKGACHALQAATRTEVMGVDVPSPALLSAAVADKKAAVTPEVLAQLKAIRSRLAAALDS